MTRLLRVLLPYMVVASIVLVIAVRSRAPGSTYPIAKDVNSAKQLAHLVSFVRPNVPLAEDGRIDMYRLLRDASENPEVWVEVCRRDRSGQGPTLEEIEAGDYSNFPYARWKGPLPEETVPVLWDREPDREGMRVVAFSDGVADVFDPAAWEDVRPR